MLYWLYSLARTYEMHVHLRIVPCRWSSRGICEFFRRFFHHDDNYCCYRLSFPSHFRGWKS